MRIGAFTLVHVAAAQPGIDKHPDADEQDERTRIIETHQGTVFRMLSRMVRDHQKVEDLAQEVFLRVFRGLPHFRGQAEFTTWLYRIVYNVVADDYRKNKSAPHMLSLDNEEDGLAERVPDRTLGAREKLEKRETAEQVREALKELPPKFQMVLTLFYIEERKYKEIAEVLALPVGTVKTYLHRGRGVLRKVLTEGTMKADEKGRTLSSANVTLKAIS